MSYKKISELEPIFSLSGQDQFVIVQNGVTKRTNTASIVNVSSVAAQNQIEQTPLNLKSIIASTSTSTGALVVEGGVAIKGNLNLGSSLRLLPQAPIESTSTTTGVISATGGIGITGNLNAGGLIRCGLTNAAVSTSTGTGTVVVSGGIGVSGRVSCGDIATGALTSSGVVSINSNIQSSNSNTGSLVVNGSVGVNGNINLADTRVLNIGSNFTPISVDSLKPNLLRVNGSVAIKDNLVAGGNSKFNLIDVNNVDVSGEIRVGNGLWSYGNLRIEAETQSSSSNTGAMVVSGGVGVGGNLNVDGTIKTNNLEISNDLTVEGNLAVNGTMTTINSTNISVDDKNIELGSVEDPDDNTALGGGITLKGSTDKRIYWGLQSWNSNQNINLESGNSFRINNTVVLNNTTLGEGVVNSSLTKIGTLTSLSVSGQTNIGSGTASTSTETGALVISGGVGVSGNINCSRLTTSVVNTGNIQIGTQAQKATLVYSSPAVRTYTIPNAGANAEFVMNGGPQTISGNKVFTNLRTDNIHNVSGTAMIQFISGYGTTIHDSVSVRQNLTVWLNSELRGNVGITAPSASISRDTGALVVAGGVGISGNINVAGTNNRFTGNTASTNTSTGTLVVTGGIGIGGNINAGGTITAAGMGVTGNLVVQGTTPSTNTGTGSFVLSGGASIGGNLHVGGGIFAANLPRKFSQVIGTGIDLNIAVNHNLNTRDVIVNVYRNSDPWESINDVSIRRTNNNSINLVFNSAPILNGMKVVVVG
jgi:hypothetical protein